MKILIVEDDARKYGKIKECAIACGVSEGDIFHKVTASEAVTFLKGERVDLLLLDVNIPRRNGEGSERGAGLGILRELHRDETLNRPGYVVGVTAYEDAIEEFGPEFEEHLWALVHFKDGNDFWAAQLTQKIRYIRAVLESRRFSDGKTFGTDLAIITAVEDVEFAAVRRLDAGWQALRLKNDEARYIVGTLRLGGRDASVIAVNAPRMGMAASAILATKVVQQFRPRLLAMVGICAGRIEKVNVGDIIVADPTWDWGSGKIKSENDLPVFEPRPHQLDLMPDIAEICRGLSKDRDLLNSIRAKATGNPPPYELNAHVGPMVSGAAVVAHKPTFDKLLTQHGEILGLDMEAYAVAAAALGAGKPRPQALVIKAVCDYADKDKAGDYQAYAASVSTAFAIAAADHILLDI